MIKKIELDERRPSLELAELLAISLKIPEPDQALFIKLAIMSSVELKSLLGDARLRPERDQLAVCRHHTRVPVNIQRSFRRGFLSLTAVRDHRSSRLPTNVDSFGGVCILEPNAAR